MLSGLTRYFHDEKTWSHEWMDNYYDDYYCNHTCHIRGIMEIKLKEELFNRLRELTELQQIKYAVICLQNAVVYVRSPKENDWDFVITFQSITTLARLQLAATSDIFTDRQSQEQLQGIGKIIANVSDTVNKLEKPSWTPPVHNDEGDEYNQ